MSLRRSRAGGGGGNLLRPPGRRRGGGPRRGRGHRAGRGPFRAGHLHRGLFARRAAAHQARHARTPNLRRAGGRGGDRGAGRRDRRLARHRGGRRGLRGRRGGRGRRHGRRSRREGGRAWIVSSRRGRCDLAHGLRGCPRLDPMTQALGLGPPPDAVGLRFDDARRVALDPDAQIEAQVEGFLVGQPELSSELVHTDLACQGATRPSPLPQRPIDIPIDRRCHRTLDPAPPSSHAPAPDLAAPRRRQPPPEPATPG